MPSFPSDAHEKDRELVREILGGSVGAWHAFVETYAGLIHHVVSRYIPSREEARGVEVDVLEQLYRVKLRSYEGRSSLSTWVVLVTRNATLDAIRRRFGRRVLPRGLDRLDERDRDVFRLYYVEGLAFEAVVHRMSGNGHAFTREDLFDALGRIESEVSDRALRRVMQDLSAQSVGASSRRLLEYMHHAHRESEEHAASETPEGRLLRREAESTGRAVLEYLKRLPDEERRVVFLRFEQGRTAKEIAREMGLPTQRRVYTILDRVHRRVRRVFRDRWSWTSG